MSTLIISIENSRFRPHVEYTFRTLFTLMGLTNYTFDHTHRTPTIYFGKNPPQGQHPMITIYPSGEFWEHYGTERSLPQAVYMYEGVTPVIYIGTSTTHMTFTKVQITTDLDIIASSFFMLSRYEEFYQPKKLDSHHRFPAQHAFAYTHGFLDKPVVNMYTVLLKQWLETIAPNTYRFNDNFWAGKSFAFCMTHDVDTLAGKTWKDTIKDDIKNMIKGKYIGFYEFLQHNLNYLTGKNPAYTFPFILVQGNKAKTPSTWFFMSHKRHYEYDINEYSVTAKNTKQLFNQLIGAGHEIGLHSSYGAFDSQKFLQEEYNTLSNSLGNTELGVRQHFLRFDVPHSWELQAKTRFSYDSTLGFADHEGFRAGICHPFRPFDLSTEKELPIWEIPLIWMEGTLINYRKLSEKEIIQNFQYYLTIVEKYHGVLTILWHNATLSHHDCRSLYIKSLRLMQEHTCLPLTLRKMLKLFNNNK